MLDTGLSGVAAGYTAAMQIVLGQLLKTSPEREAIFAKLEGLIAKLDGEMTEAALADDADRTAYMIEAHSAASIFLATMEDAVK